jgi:hypothetical protein
MAKFKIVARKVLSGGTESANTLASPANRSPSSSSLDEDVQIWDLETNGSSSSRLLLSARKSIQKKELEIDSMTQKLEAILNKSDYDITTGLEDTKDPFIDARYLDQVSYQRFEQLDLNEDDPELILQNIRKRYSDWFNMSDMDLTNQPLPPSLINHSLIIIPVSRPRQSPPWDIHLSIIGHKINKDGVPNLSFGTMHLHFDHLNYLRQSNSHLLTPNLI